MLAENLKTLRKSKGLSQEELAIRVHVVRQTVSKWEKGLSTPDAETLVQLADTFEVSVSEMLGAKIENEQDSNAIVEQLSRINEYLAIRNRRTRRIWKVVAIVFVALLLATALFWPNLRRTEVGVMNELPTGSGVVTKCQVTTMRTK